MVRIEFKPPSPLEEFIGNVFVMTCSTAILDLIYKEVVEIVLKIMLLVGDRL